MRPVVWVQAGNIEIGSLIHEAPILSAQSPVVCQEIVGAGAIEECAPGLRRCAYHSSASVVGRIKNQNATAGKDKWPKTAEIRHCRDSCASDFMNVGLHACGGQAGCVRLRVPRVTIVGLRCEPIAGSHSDSRPGIRRN